MNLKGRYISQGEYLHMHMMPYLAGLFYFESQQTQEYDMTILLHVLLHPSQTLQIKSVVGSL